MTRGHTLPEKEFCQDAANRPDIHPDAVVLGSEEKFWSSIPPGDHDVSVNTSGRTKISGQAKVTQLEATFAVHQEIVGFEVAVKDPVVVEILQSEQGLQSVGFDVCRGQDDAGVLDDDLQICVHEVHHDGDIGPVSEHVNQLNDVLVFDLLQEFNFSESCPVDAILGLGPAPQLDLLHRHDPLSLFVPGLVHGGKLTLAEEIDLLISE